MDADDHRPTKRGNSGTPSGSSNRPNQPFHTQSDPHTGHVSSDQFDYRCSRPAPDFQGSYRDRMDWHGTPPNPHNVRDMRDDVGYREPYSLSSRIDPADGVRTPYLPPPHTPSTVGLPRRPSRANVHNAPFADVSAAGASPRDVAPLSGGHANSRATYRPSRLEGEYPFPETGQKPYADVSRILEPPRRPSVDHQNNTSMSERPPYVSSYTYYNDKPSEFMFSRPRSPATSTRHPYPALTSPHLAQVERAELAHHREKRARIDPYSDRSQPGFSEPQRPPTVRASSSYLSSASKAEWSDRPGVRTDGLRTPLEEPWRRETLAKGKVDKAWLDAEGSYLPRRLSNTSREYAAEATTARSVDSGTTGAHSNNVKRRKRAVLSCTECKQRKIKCDRNVPNCGSCVRRGVAHLCRWGDERDYLPTTQNSSITPSNAALMARIAQLESQVRVLQTSTPSSAANNESATSERRTAPNLMHRSEVASEFSSGQSSRFSNDSVSNAPPNFTSRERIASSNRYVGADDAKSTGGLDDGVRDASDESEDSDSPESGAEDAEEVLHALAKGTSMRQSSGAKATHQDRLQRDSTHAVPQSTHRHLPSGTSVGSNKGAKGSLPSEVQGQADVQIDEKVIAGHDNRTDTDDRGGSLFVLDAISAFPRSWDYSRLMTEFFSIMTLLPSREKVEALIRHYLNEAEPLVNALHLPSFLRQLERFWGDYEQAQDRRGSSVRAALPDLQFAALVFAMCEGACEYMTPAEVLSSNICMSRTLINEQLTLLSRSCLALLGMSQFMRRPNICGFQALIALRHFCYNRDHRDEYQVLSSMALKAAELVGLHRLGSALKDEERWHQEHRSGQYRASNRSDKASQGHSSDASSSSQHQNSHRWKMLTSTKIQDALDTDSEGEDLDPERHDLNAMWLPRGHQRKKWDTRATKRYYDGSRVHREMGRKVWFALATMDWMSAAFFDRCYYCKDEMFTTQSPQNIDDVDLSDGEPMNPDSASMEDNARGPATSFTDKIRPHDLPTSNSFIPIHIEICHTVRSIADAMNHGDESFETVMAIEERFRSILRSLPRFYRLDGECEYDPKIHQLHRDRPYLSLQRAVIHEYVYHRLLKLHRLFMSRGYRNAKYIHSTRTCIESARVVIGILRALDSVGCRGQRYWIFKFHIFHAVLALQVDLLYLARQPISDEIISKRADVISALKMLHARTDAQGRNPMLASSLKVIKVLREEERARRTRISATGTGSGNTTSDAPAPSSPSERNDSQSPRSTRKLKSRGWTGASDSTGELAEHLERRIQDTWYTVAAESLRGKAKNAASAGPESAPLSDRPSSPSIEGLSSSRVSRPSSRVGSALRGAGTDEASRAPSTQDDSSVDTFAADLSMGYAGRAAPPTADLADQQEETLARLTTAPKAQGETADTELDEYLRLLSSYQNPHNMPGGSNFFDVLDDLVFENAPADPMSFERNAMASIDMGLTSHLASSQVLDANLIRSENDLAAAGAGFDAFTAV